MSYQVIARKFRPARFDELVGQDHVSQTLLNALKNARLHHAILLTGPRGTGKTSTARILAKSLRCQKAVDFVPCGQCSDCLEIATSRSVDVLEIDGASNNGVDSVRELRDSVAFLPSSGKYRVIIIDEVHMLSTAAFNALLKTLEEPPAHIIFIFATTEVHKIPATILSRCQRFDFRRIKAKVVVERLQKICQAEKLSVTEEALWILARQGDGSMRDTESLLDQVVTFSSGEVTGESVISILGLTSQQMVRGTLDVLVKRNVPGLAELLSQMNSSGVEPHLFVEQLIESLRNLSLVASLKEQSFQVLEMGESDQRFLKDLAAQTTVIDLQLLFDMALKGAQDMSRATEPRWVLEMLLLRMSQAPTWAELPTFDKLVETGNVQVTNHASQQTQAPRPTQAPAPASAPASPAKPKIDIGKALGRSVATSLKPEEKWFEFVQKVKAQDSMFGSKLEPIVFLKHDASKIHLAAPAKMTFLKEQLSTGEGAQKLNSFLASLWQPGMSFEITLQKESGGVSAKSLTDDKARIKDEELLSQIAQDPKVKKFNQVFKGRVQGFTDKPNTDKK